jgi:hypothetical protein
MRLVSILIFAAWCACSCGNREGSGTKHGPENKSWRLYTSTTWTDSLRKNFSPKWSPTHGVTDFYFAPDGKTVWVTDGLAGSYETKIKKTGPRSILLQPVIPDSFTLTCFLNDQNQWSTKLKDGKTILLDEVDSTLMENEGPKRFAFKQRANQILFEGSYKVTYCDDGKESGVWNFDKDGSLSGPVFYKFYEPCLNGDCVLYCDEMDIVFLSSIKGQPSGRWVCLSAMGIS